METPLKISFQGSQPSDALSRMIAEEVEALEKFHGRLTACHVNVRVPPHGGRYAVNIHLALPGHLDINVDHVSDDDERFIDPQFAVGDAFRRAGRQLKERARKQRGETKRLRERVERTLAQPDPPKKP
ncbi:MAG: HPF/RaiA family ribosome-associated protein [Enhydrobacter sp.]|nr:MAG: HPF/RaiA family ribosome-associated protein [Enhydrobacter sp.]